MLKNLNLDLKILNENTTVVLALSGGRDSMVLLDLLIKNKIKTIIAHVNHKKRLESDLEEEYIKNFAKDNNLICEVTYYTSTNKINFQADAHIFRYNFFYDIAKKYNAKYILTAHHADDLAETVLLRLITGSNLYGYGGISLFNNYKDISIYRPLLYYSRLDIDNYININNIYYFEDSSNQSNDYLRNRIRHEIIPLLKKENNNFLDGIINYSSILKDSFNYIRNNTIAYLNGNLEINLETYNLLDIALKKDILSYLLEQYNLKPSFKLINDLLKLIDNSKPQLEYNLAKNYVFYKRYNKVYIDKSNKIISNNIKINLDETKDFNSYYKFSLTKSNINAKSIKIWYNQEDLPLTIRNRLPGDYLEFNFGKKKLKDYFIDKKIDREKRNNIPLILNKNGKIVAVFNLLNLSKGENYCYLYGEVKNEK